jgi:lipopolysaccharide transport system ATP-binding protein
MTLDSDHNQPPLQMQSGIYEIHFYVDRNPLHPGIYSAGVAILSNAFTLDFIPNVVTWEVSSGSTDLIGDRAYGGCRLPVKVLALQPS